MNMQTGSFSKDPRVQEKLKQKLKLMDGFFQQNCFFRLQCVITASERWNTLIAETNMMHDFSLFLSKINPSGIKYNLYAFLKYHHFINGSLSESLLTLNLNLPCKPAAANSFIFFKSPMRLF